jgi:hypothetical protein
VKNMFFPIVLNEQMFGAKKQVPGTVTGDKNHLCVSKANRAAIKAHFIRQGTSTHPLTGGSK